MIPYLVKLKIKCGCNVLGYYWTQIEVQAPSKSDAVAAAKEQFAGKSKTLMAKIIDHQAIAYA